LDGTKFISDENMILRSKPRNFLFFMFCWPCISIYSFKEKPN